MTSTEIVSEDNLLKLCIPMGTAVSAKFRGAFCEALVNNVERIILCRVQLIDNKKTLKVNAEDIIGNILANSKVQVKLPNGVSNGIILKVIDNSMYHVVFNDGDTGKLRRNQLVLKGDRHYKESESLDKHPLTNPEHFTKAVIYEKRLKDRSDMEDDDFDNDDQKSCSQESLTTVSSNKTRRQQTHTSSPSVGTVGSSLTAKTSDDVNKTPVSKITKHKKQGNSKYLIGCLVIANRIVRKLASAPGEKLMKKHKPFIGLIVSPSSCDGETSPDIKATQCVVKSFSDNFWYVALKRELELVVKRDMIIKYKESDPSTFVCVEKCLLFFDAKILPDLWDGSKLLYSTEYPTCEDLDQSEKSNSKSRLHSSLTNSLSSLDSSSSEDEDNKNENRYNSSDQEYQNAKDEWVARFYGFWEDKGNPVNQRLEIQSVDIDIYQLYELVKEFGGFQKVTTSVRWPFIYYSLKLPNNKSTENYQRLQSLYRKFIYPYVDMKKKLGTFEQLSKRKHNEKPLNISQKVRPLLSARERREYVRQASRKTTEALSVSSQSVCERPIDHGVSGDEIGTNSLIEDTSQLSQCSSSPKPIYDRMPEEFETKTSSVVPVSRLSPGTIVSVAYGDKKVYKAKIIQQHSPENKSLKSPSIESKNTSKVSKTNGDSMSNADSVSSANNEFKPEIDSSTFYKVHYIGWNSRHDEIIAPTRILEIISDAGMDNQSTCSSSCRQKPTISDTEQALEITSTVVNESCALSSELVIDETIIEISDDGPNIPEESMIMEENIQTVEGIICNDQQCEEVVTKEPDESRPSKQVNLKRRRSRSVCLLDFSNIPVKKMAVVPESRFIESLNLYKIGDKMPIPPKRFKLDDADKISENLDEQYKAEIQSLSSSFEFTIDCPNRSSMEPVNNDDDSVQVPKNEFVKYEEEEEEEEDDKSKHFFKSERNRSPSFSNDSFSDASTLSFRNEQDQSLFYMSPFEDSEKSSPAVLRPAAKTANKRGRKPLFRSDKKPPLNSSGRHRDNRMTDIIEIESTSSQHSGSAHGRRVTRSLRTASEQNTIDDNSIQYEDDSQTSQDDTAFQLPLDVRSTSMVPLATGTPNLHTNKGRRPKSRRTNRNSMSTSSADGGYQDSNGEATGATVTLPYSDNATCMQTVTVDSNSHNFISNTHRPSGRIFQRLHPSLIPIGLEKLPPEERVKLLESVIRQTHLNFLDVKDKLKYVEKQILEIRAGRANGHGIESDEDKFR